MAEDGGDRKAVLNLQRKWAKALVEADAGTISELAADEYLGISPNGKITKKAALISAMKSKRLQIHESKMNEVRIEVIGKVAVTTYRTTDEGVFGSTKISGDFRWLDIAVKRGGKWECLASQGTRIASTDAR